MRRFILALAMSLAGAACSGAPASPMGPAAGPAPSTSTAFDGTWKIDVMVDHCYDRHCFAAIGKTRTLLVRLVTMPWGVEGIFSPGTQAAVEITGGIAGGQIDLRGGARSPLPGSLGSYDIEFATLKASLSAQGLSGSVDYKSHGYLTPIDLFPGGYGGPILRAERLDTGVSESFTGVWSGQAAVKSCSGVTSPYCWPDDRHYMTDAEIQLLQTGGTVTGTVKLGSRSIPIKGTAAGASLVLTESLPSSGAATTITSFTATRDKLGRLEGTLQYQTFRDGLLVSTYDRVDLWSVILR